MSSTPKSDPNFWISRLLIVVSKQTFLFAVLFPMKKSKSHISPFFKTLISKSVKHLLPNLILKSFHDFNSVRHTLASASIILHYYTKHTLWSSQTSPLIFTTVCIHASTLWFTFLSTCIALCLHLCYSNSSSPNSLAMISSLTRHLMCYCYLCSHHFPTGF